MHSTRVKQNIRENDEVTFDLEEGKNGLNAVNVKLSQDKKHRSELNPAIGGIFFVVFFQQLTGNSQRSLKLVFFASFNDRINIFAL